MATLKRLQQNMKKHKLVDEHTCDEIPIGSKRKTFRGEEVVVKDFEPPKHSGSTGRVYVTFKSGSASYFPSVIGAKIV